LPSSDAGRAELDAGSEPDGGEGTLPDYPREGITPLAPACKDARAILGKARYGDAGLVLGLRQALLANPELEVIAGSPSGPRQIELWQTSYGGKVFSRESAPGFYAVIARCADPGACLDLAALVKAALPGSEPSLSCGDPPAISGGKEPLRGPWTIPAALPNAASRPSVCARITACSARLGGRLGAPVAQACEQRPLADAARCAAAERCPEVVRCFEGKAGP
jgi:hypothetical protein